jgi:RecG-like helicase
VSDLKRRFTDNQTSKLEEAGIFSVYDLVTYLPIGIREVIPLNQTYYPKEKVKYLWEARLEKVSRRPGKNSFLVLHFRDENRSLQTYFFSKASFVLSQLKEGNNYQLLLTYKSNKYWTAEKIAPLQEDNKVAKMILGKAEVKKYLDTYYQRIKALQSNYFKLLHNRLKREDYILNLKGLVPPSNGLIPVQIDLYKLHYPNSSEDYTNSLKEWLALKVYLRLCLVKYINSLREERQAKEAVLDLNFLKAVANNLPYQLSISQKKVIWEILKEITKQSS